MSCAIWYHLYNLKNEKNTRGGMLLLVKTATLLKVTLLHGCFLRFSNCTNGTKSRKASHMKDGKKKIHTDSIQHPCSSGTIYQHVKQ